MKKTEDSSENTDDIIAKISFPVPEKVSANRIYSGLHWTKRNKLKDLYHFSLLEFRKLKIEKFPIHIHYIFEWKNNPLDSTNQFFMIKMLEDGMVANGIIPDDSPKYVRATTSEVMNSLKTEKNKHDTITIVFRNTPAKNKVL